MIKFELTTDPETIKRIVTHPRIWAGLSDDFDGQPEEYEPQIHDRVVYALPKDGDTVLGLLIFAMHSTICWEVTIMVLPAGLGRALDIAEAGKRWIFGKTNCLRLIGRVIKTNRLALKLNKAAGFKVYGVNQGCVLVGGKLEDYVLFGLSRRDLDSTFWSANNSLERPS